MAACFFNFNPLHLDYLQQSSTSFYPLITICSFMSCYVILKVVGLDLVDDESKPERRPTKHMPTPAQWTNVFNPAFSYYVYYCYANLYTLNKVRKLLHFSVFLFCSCHQSPPSLAGNRLLQPFRNDLAFLVVLGIELVKWIVGELI